MYNGYPLAAVIIYLEAPNDHILLHQTQQIRNIVHAATTYFISRHAKFCLASNTTQPDKSKSITRIPSKDYCLSDIFYCGGHTAAEVIDFAIQNQLQAIDRMRSENALDIQLLPIYLVAVQYEGTPQKVSAQLFENYAQNLKVFNFTFSHAARNFSENAGGADRLKTFLQPLLCDEVSAALADASAHVRGDIPIQPQRFFSLE